MSKRKEVSFPAPAERTRITAQAEHEAERLAYLATLDSRQREMLDPP